MKILVLISMCLAVIHGAPTSQVKKSSGGPLADALSSSTTIKPSASLENEKPADDSRRPKMINYYGYYPGYGFGAPQAAAAAFMNAGGAGGTPTGGIGGGPSAYSPYDFYQFQFPYGTIAPVFSYNGLLGGDSSDDNGYDNEVQSSANDVDSGDDYDEDIFSRANRRRPGAGKGGNNRNSPIFYIRLPPTPYMFIRGLGYISNPPTITPLPTPVPSFGYPSPYQNPNPYMSMPAANPYMQPSNPFINMPLNFMSNAKPVGVYQYQSQPAPAMRFPINGYGPNQVAPLRQRPQFGMGPTSSNGNSGYNNPDSKITHLKGPFIFNGRPEDIYLLQNLQTTPYNANFFHGYY